MAVFKFRNLKNGQAMPIPPGEFLVGRADEAYVHIEDPSVSRRHAQVINNDAGFFIEDLGSSNGTAVRGAYITRRMNITLGEVIYVGSVPFRVDPEIGGEPDATPSPGMRPANRAYVRKHTERLPLQELSQIEEQSSSGKLAAVEPPPAEEPKPTEQSAPKSGATIVPAKRGTHPESTLLPAAPETPSESPRPEPLKRPSPAASIQAQLHEPAETGAPEPMPEPESEMIQATPVEPIAMPAAPGRAWFILFFLAGMGVGLLLGLFFAKLFIDMGGKAALLP